MPEIKFTHEQFENLLKTVYLGNWMINSHLVEDLGASEHLQEYLLSKAHEFGLEKYQHPDNHTDPSKYFEEQVDEYIEEYNEQAFWEQLSERMAGSQIGKLFTQQEIDKMEPMERFALVSTFIEEYEKEFSENGLANLFVRSEDFRED